MRVAHIITRMIIGGAQENTLLNCLDLIEQYGDTVQLITGPSQGPEGALLEQGRAGGLDVLLVPQLRRAISPWQDLQAYRQLRRSLRSFRPDVVHTHSAKGGWLGRLAAWHEQVPVVVHSVHGAPFHEYQSAAARRFFIACERWAARRCHHFICVADAMTERMVSARVAPAEKFTTIYSGMRIEPFMEAVRFRAATRQQLQIPEDAVVVGKIARLFHLKGHDDLIQAARSAIPSHPQLRFLLVGDGLLRPQLESLVRQHGLERHFIFVGLVPPEQIPNYLGAMDMLVHTSLREGLARTLPQALLAGLPAISYDVDGAREVVRDRQTGRLIPPRQVDRLTTAITELADHPSLRQAFGKAGQQLCQERFCHRHMTDRIRQLYSEQLARNGFSSRS
jgi:glycosyltransferase involved in cell wall biosynthesis